MPRKALSETEPDLLNPEPRTEAELHEAKARLNQLRREAEELEQKARELEELQRKREEVVSGQKMMKERFQRALIVLERAEYEATREVEQIQLTRKAFSEHLASLEEINPSRWEPSEIEEQLNRSLTLIDQSKMTYSQSRAKINALNGRDFEEESSTQGADQDTDAFTGGSFLTIMWKGFAFTLPLSLALIILAMIILVRS
jgi:chromosome segregation ATPase